MSFQVRIDGGDYWAFQVRIDGGDYWAFQVRIDGRDYWAEYSSLWQCLEWMSLQVVDLQESDRHALQVEDAAKHSVLDLLQLESTVLLPFSSLCFSSVDHLLCSLMKRVASSLLIFGMASYFDLQARRETSEKISLLSASYLS
eukprot:CAMPEP_0167765572 /NCGR_PEP_ID=MMETSP0110_2-20121227/14782_1 /TAXON_ID=629695 /ORGANISM="Gymnochlora sp., Strain CCMP2014" /LENGTH=142 /DNA_ID=CAMNT_0007653341 /DNA_START=882 /DNA_END=1310 /DNA_ORIENTATION=+